MVIARRFSGAARLVILFAPMINSFSEAGILLLFCDNGISVTLQKYFNPNKSQIVDKKMGAPSAPKNESIFMYNLAKQD
jgi:hypothetical protein